MRILEGELDQDEQQLEAEIRPRRFDEFPGQKSLKEKLSVFMQAAKLRGESLDHTLFHGPPGLGKTTLAHILASEMGVEIRTTSGPAIDKKGDVAALLTSLAPNSILFIDEIHRLHRQIEEYLYSAMEDFYLDIVTGEGLGARSMKFQLPPFTLVGATTRVGLLNPPFRDRFGIVERLSFYDAEDLELIVKRSSQILKIEISDEGSKEIARRCRGTPRIANRLLKRIRDYAQIKGEGKIDQKIADYALKQLEVDGRGLDSMDRRLLKFIAEKFDGGPVGIETLAAALGEERETLEDVYEPFLIQEGFLHKTPRGRVITKLACEHLGLPVVNAKAQLTLDDTVQL